jgi:hypothetical protein
MHSLEKDIQEILHLCSCHLHQISIVTRNNVPTIRTLDNTSSEMCFCYITNVHNPYRQSEPRYISNAEVSIRYYCRISHRAVHSTVVQD